jgi:hypothetical protein
VDRRARPERLGPGYLGEYNVVSAFVYEVVATFLFLVCILGVTHPFAPTGFAGLAIGLTLVAIHLVGINITGTSVNPARSIGPALVGVASNPGAVAQLWLFIIAPLIGAGAAGFLYRDRRIPGRAEEGLSEAKPGGAGILRRSPNENDRRRPPCPWPHRRPRTQSKKRPLCGGPFNRYDAGQAALATTRDFTLRRNAA